MQITATLRWAAKNSPQRETLAHHAQSFKFGIIAFELIKLNAQSLPTPSALSKRKLDSHYQLTDVNQTSPVTFRHARFLGMRSGSIQHLFIFLCFKQVWYLTWNESEALHTAATQRSPYWFLTITRCGSVFSASPRHNVHLCNFKHLAWGVMTKNRFYYETMDIVNYAMDCRL